MASLYELNPCAQDDGLKKTKRGSLIPAISQCLFLTTESQVVKMIWARYLAGMLIEGINPIDSVDIPCKS